MAQPNQISFGMQSIVAPDLQVQQAQLQRAQQLADYLRQQSIAPIEATQTSGGRAVPISLIQGLAKLGQSYFAKGMQSDTDQKQTGLNQEMAKRYADILQGGNGNGPQDWVNQAPGGSGDPTKMPQPGQIGSGMAGDVTPPNGQVMPPQSQPNNFGMANLLRGSAISTMGGEQASAAYWDQFKPTETIKNNNYMGITSDQARQFELAKRLKEGTMSLQPGQTNIMPNGEKVVAPNFESGVSGGFDSSGNPIAMEIPGATNIAARRAGAVAGSTKAAELPYGTPTVVNAPEGPLLMTPQQQIAAANGAVPQTGGEVKFNGVKFTPGFLSYLQKNDPESYSAAIKEMNNKQAGGLPLQSEAQKEFQTGQAKNAVTASAALNERVRVGHELVARLAESRDALKDFKAGAGSETRLKVAQFAQAIGAPESMVNGIAGGNIAAMQEFQKLATTQAMETLKQAMQTDTGQGSRIALAEFQQFLKVNPNLSTDPRAIDKIYAFSEKIHNRNLSEQQAFDQWIEKGNDPARWSAAWSQKLEQERNKPTTPPQKIRKYNPQTGLIE